MFQEFLSFLSAIFDNIALRQSTSTYERIFLELGKISAKVTVDHDWLFYVKEYVPLAVSLISIVVALVTVVLSHRQFRIRAVIDMESKTEVDRINNFANSAAEYLQAVEERKDRSRTSKQRYIVVSCIRSDSSSYEVLSRKVFIANELVNLAVDKSEHFNNLLMAFASMKRQDFTGIAEAKGLLDEIKNGRKFDEIEVELITITLERMKKDSEMMSAVNSQIAANLETDEAREKLRVEALRSYINATNEIIGNSRFNQKEKSFYIKKKVDPKVISSKAAFDQFVLDLSGCLQEYSENERNRVYQEVRSF